MAMLLRMYSCCESYPDRPEKENTQHHFQPPRADFMPGSEGQDHHVRPDILRGSAEVLECHVAT